MKKIVLTLVAGLTVVAVSAQKKGIQDGDRLFKAFEYTEAAAQYSEVAAKYPTNLEVLQKLARAYVLAGDHANAEATYAQIVKLPDAPAINHYYYAQELRANGKYEEAENEFTVYAQKNPNDPLAAEFAGSLEQVNNLLQDKKEYTVNLFPLNSTESDIAPSYYKDGVIFSSNRDVNPVIVRGQFYDLYIGKSDANGHLTSVKKWKGKQVNKQLHEGTVIFNAAGNEIYFTGSNRTKGKQKRGKNKETNLKIYHAEYDSVKKEWTGLLPLPFSSNEYSVAHPSLSKDERRLYFVSDMPGGYGETDIYVSHRYASSWSKPVNLGKNINTAGSELFPYITDSVLYFASDSRVGLGGLDIYSVAMSGLNIGNNSVQNLGAPFNTNFDDFGLIIDEKGEKGYFVSNRSGGLGSDDIYAFERKVKLPKKEKPLAQNTLISELPKAQFNADAIKTAVIAADSTIVKSIPAVAEKVEDKATEEKAQSTVETETPVAVEEKTENTVVPEVPLAAVEEKVQDIVETETPAESKYSLSVAVALNGSKGSVEGTVLTLTNKTTGKQQSEVVAKASAPKFAIEPDQHYELTASKVSENKSGKYSSLPKSVSTQGIAADLIEMFELNYLEPGQIIKEDIYFDLGKWTINSADEFWLNKVVKHLQAFPELELEISSHTDCIGTEEYNQYLSTQRLHACLNWLTAKGVDVKRIFAVAYGESRPAVNCECENCTEAENQANRRIEIRVLKLN